MTQSNKSNLIEFNKVTIVRGNKAILDHASFQIVLGENVAILGPNGSGKSTLIKTITREYYPLEESSEHIPVRILGEDRWNIFDLRLLLGIVSGDLQTLCTKPIKGKELIISGFLGSIGIYPNHEVTPMMVRKAEEILGFLEIPYLADKPLTEMSTGEARRVLIGMALVHEPKALILDEPTNSLDLKSAYKFRQTMRKLAKHGTSIILVTHHIEDLIPEISRVILLKEGKIFLDGPKQEVINSKNLSELFSLPVQVRQENEFYHIWHSADRL